MKRLLLFLYAFMIPITALWAHDVEIDGIYYNLDQIKKTAEVRCRGEYYHSYDNEYSGSVTIPETITYNSQTYSVSSIGDYAFGDCSGLTSVTIPNSVTSIGSEAFYDCSGLTKVNYLGNVDKWVEIDFDGYATNPTTYAKDFYINNELLTDVKITTADSIKKYAFCNCQSIKSVEIGNSVTSIGSSAFENCNGLTSVTIPNSVTSIDSNAFSGCSGLTKVNYLGTVDKWVEFDFEDSDSNPTYYAKDLYINNELLNDIKITTVDSIKKYAFYNCQNIKSVEIGNSVTSIGYNAFNGTGIYNNESNWDNGVLYIDNCLIEAKYDLVNGSYIIKEGTRFIADYAFVVCSGLTSVTIPNSVTSIGSGAFHSCSGLTSVTIPNSVTSIGSSAFENCNGLTSVTIPNSVTSIDSNAFYGCSGLTKVNYLGTVDKWVEIDFKPYDSNPTRYAKDFYINNELLTDVKITTADSIKNFAFINCKSIKSVEIGNCVTSIGSEAFSGCSGLTSVTIPNSVTSIGYWTFSGCSRLTSVTIPNSVTSIGSSAFSDCSGLTSVTIPNSVTTIDSYTFSGCSGLTEILVSSNNDEFSSENGVLYNKGKTTLIKYPAGKKDTSFTIPNSVTSIGSSAFRDCNGLTSVTIPNSVTSIGSGAFNNTGIYEDESNWDNGVLYIDNCLIKAKSDVVKGSYTIKKGTRIFGSSAFSGCSGLTEVTIPNSVTSIGDGAFYYSGLKKVNYLGTVDKWLEFDWDYRSSNPTYYAKDLYINNELLTDVKITTADSIKDYAFYNCQSIKSVVIGDSVISIGGEAFSGCNSLKTVYNCSNLEIIKGNEDHGNVARYADEVINACPVGDFIVNYEDEIIEYIGDTTINKIEIPEFVTGIEPDVFASCANIDTIVWNAINCADFTETTTPFNAQAAQIKSVIFGNDVEYIPAYLCSDMTLLTEISIPGKVNSIGENAFVGCSRLRYITSYPTLVPLAKESSFNSYSAYLYIPCDYYDYYYLDDVFGKFKEIKCISAEEVEGSDKVEIEVDSNNNATIIWPSTGNASSYELVISKNGEVLCTLLFNENGQLTSIDFGNRSASVGFQFTVTGLEGASKYSYSIVAKDEKGNELESYNGTFTTNGYSEVTAILETLADANITVSGGLITCSDAEFTIYNTLGQDVTAYNGSLQPGVYVVSVADDVVKVMMK